MINDRFKSNLFYLIVSITLLLGTILMYNLGANDKFIEISYMYLFILIPVILYIIKNKKSFTNVLRLNKVNPQQIFIAMVLVLAVQPLLGFASVIMQNLLGENFLYAVQEGMMESGINENIFISLFIIAITPAICEEVFMRGVMLDGYRNISLWKVAIMNGVLFGLFHNNFMQLSYTTIFGVVLSYVVILTNSIYPAIVMHFIINALSVFWDYYPNSIYANFTNWYESNIVLLVIFAVISIVATILLIKWLRKVSINHSNEIINNENEIIDNKSDSVTFVEWPLMLATAISIVYSIYY